MNLTSMSTRDAQTSLRQSKEASSAMLVFANAAGNMIATMSVRPWRILLDTAKCIWMNQHQPYIFVHTTDSAASSSHCKFHFLGIWGSKKWRQWKQLLAISFNTKTCLRFLTVLHFRLVSMEWLGILKSSFLIRTEGFHFHIQCPDTSNIQTQKEANAQQVIHPRDTWLSRGL